MCDQHEIDEQYILAFIEMQEQAWVLQKENAWLRRELETLKPPNTEWRRHTESYLRQTIDERKEEDNV